MGRKAKFAATPATLQLEAAGVPFIGHTYSPDPRSSSYGAEAARLLGIDERQVFKTLMVSSGSGPGAAFVVALLPVAATLDLKALGSVLGIKKLVLADPAVAMRRSGYVLGGISALGQRQSSPTVIDDSSSAWESILVSGGRRGFSLELSPRDLGALTNAVFAPIAHF